MAFGFIKKVFSFGKKEVIEEKIDETAPLPPLNFDALKDLKTETQPPVEAKPAEKPDVPLPPEAPAPAPTESEPKPEEPTPEPMRAEPAPAPVEIPAPALEPARKPEPAPREVPVEPEPVVQPADPGAGGPTSA